MAETDSDGGEGDEPNADDMALARQLLVILRDEDPEAFINAGSDLGQSVGLADHWLLPVVMLKLRRWMRNN